MNQKEIMEAVEDGGVHIQTIFEMVGKPKEHVEKAFADYIALIEKDPMFTVINKDIADVVEVEDSDSLFSTFCDMELVMKDFSNVYDFCFKYMPASVEVISPENLTLSGTDATGLVNDFLAKMHERDLEAKKTNQVMKLLTQNINILIENLTLLSLRFKPMNTEEVGKATGVENDKIVLFLDKLQKEGKVIETDGKYSLVKE